jgi:large conductance mechanosensitive channel
MSTMSDFKTFLARGNVVDLATGVIVGGAFGKIVNSLVNDIIMPPIGLLIGGVDFKNLYVVLGSGSYATLDEATKAGAPVLRYGLFLNTVLEFLIVAACIFFVIQKMVAVILPIQKQEAAADAAAAAAAKPSNSSPATPTDQPR